MQHLFCFSRGCTIGTRTDSAEKAQNKTASWRPIDVTFLKSYRDCATQAVGSRKCCSPCPTRWPSSGCFVRSLPQCGLQLHEHLSSVYRAGGASSDGITSSSARQIVYQSWNSFRRGDARHDHPSLVRREEGRMVAHLRGSCRALTPIPWWIAVAATRAMILVAITIRA